MSHHRILIFVLSAYTFSCFAEGQYFGLASSKAGTICASFGENAPPVGSPITVVDVGASQLYFEAKIGEEVEHCDLLERGQIVGPYYAVVTNWKSEAPFVGISVYGVHEVFSKNGIVYLDLPDTEERVYFRICTSSEALHYASWLGQPLSGKQLWRQYFYLDYDVEPSCVEHDFK